MRETLDEMIVAILGPTFDIKSYLDHNGRAWTRYYTHRFSIICDMSQKCNVVIDNVMKCVYRNISIAYCCIGKNDVDTETERTNVDLQLGSAVCKNILEIGLQTPVSSDLKRSTH